MIFLDRKKGHDFTVVNFSDPQIEDRDVLTKSEILQKAERTILEVTEREKPDLITVSGDLSYGHMILPYEYLRDLFDSLKVPFSPVWGNHDNERGPEHIKDVIEVFSKSKYFTYESGDPALGDGNYTIAVRDGEKIISSLIFADTHDRLPCGDGTAWGTLIPEQIEWYEKQVAELLSMGCDNSVIVEHIPMYEYTVSSDEAIYHRAEPDAHFNPGFENCVGVQLEWIGNYDLDDGVFISIEKMGHTKCVIAGHSHCNNTIIPHRGVLLSFSLKCGPGSYYDPRLIGGTVMKFGDGGFCDIFHSYVDIDGINN